VSYINTISPVAFHRGDGEDRIWPSRPPVVLIAEARMAVEFLERAADWAADVDRESVADMVRIHRRLLDKVEHLVYLPKISPTEPTFPLDQTERLTASG
jgi:hypothetical protein